MPNIHYSHCPVCGSENVHPVFNVQDYTVSQQEFQIQHCDNCTLRFTQDVPDINAIGQYYKSEDYISHTNTSKGLINTLYQKVRIRTMKQKAGIIKKYTGLQVGSLLDIGCGTGTFLHTMKQQNWQVMGLEPDADARKVCRVTYEIEAAPSDNLFSLAPHSFDAITMWHVLEHIHPLQEYMAQINLLLKPGGKLIVAVPNYSSKDANVYGKFWAGYDVPRHLYHFSPKAMQTLLHQHTLRLVKMLPMWFDSFYVDMLSSKYKTGSIKYLSAGLHGLASNINAIGKVEACCSVIYVVEKK
ncbi:MAG TPA: class I SAM-dependent methyltransferase [Niabella sp.]|nr:class I SAM-dependent methyltransferase [Niabella sp.]HQW14850.1 class I SAM-dependent methyltransferase [Niabella sp.]HQX18525.1 class I SAM-dependent methyltransferase [Niabella sp.]HQX41824.1 class I SAM-dependent methyltransferase [Niabella sp.]HRB06052.1 class I SAM-dependent methyltransferase [Niabella sp.]